MKLTLMVLIYSISSYAFSASDLSKRLWKELDLALHKTQEMKQRETDLAWLDDYEQNHKDENVDQVMAEFNQAPKESLTDDSISLRMSGLQKPEAQKKKLIKASQKSIKKSPQQRPSYSITRRRNR